MKHDMCSIGDKSVANWQETVRFPEHDLITSGAFGFRVKEIGHPRRAKLSSKDDAVADTKPHVKPMRGGRSK